MLLEFSSDYLSKEEKKRNLIFSLLALVSVLGSCGKGNIDTSLPTVNPSTQQPTDKKSTPSSEEPKKIFYTITFNLNGGEIADPTAVAPQKNRRGSLGQEANNKSDKEKLQV